MTTAALLVHSALVDSMLADHVTLRRFFASSRFRGIAERTGLSAAFFGLHRSSLKYVVIFIHCINAFLPVREITHAGRRVSGHHYLALSSSSSSSSSLPLAFPFFGNNRTGRFDNLIAWEERNIMKRAYPLRGRESGMWE
jgi:hypothetical protein